jgi:hypothetical protein
MDDPPPVLMLVHGTWPRGMLSRVLPTKMGTRRLAWFDPGSPFRQDLQTRLSKPIQFEVFEWSGYNSVKARSKAATQLGQRLAEIRRNHPKRGQLIIAHSHGGNVALQALAGLDSLTGILGVATMGTPFLQVRKREIPEYVDYMSFFARIALLLCVFATPTLLFLFKGLEIGGFWGILICGTLLWAFGNGWTWYQYPKYLIRLNSTLAEYSEALPTLRIPLLVLRCSNDEASRALSLARWAGNVNDTLWKTMALLTTAAWTWPLYGMVISLFSMFVAGLLFRQWFDYCLWAFLGFVGIIAASFPVALICLVVFSVTSGVLLLPFGSELLRLGFRLEIMVDPTTPSARRIDFTLDSSETHIAARRHSVYAFPAARERLASWINGRLREL